MQDGQLQRESTIMATNVGSLTYSSIVKLLQPPTLKTFRFNIPEICLFSSGDVELFIAQKQTNLIGQYRMLKNVPFYKLKSLLPRGDCICKYTDQNVQILSETELYLLLNKRKNDPIWKEIQYLQTQHWMNQKVLYISELDDQTQLFKRASVEIGIMTKDIVGASSQFVSDVDEEISERSLSYPQLAQYFTFKIIHFMQRVHHIKITHGIFRWSIENSRNCNFVDCQYVSSQLIPVEERKSTKREEAMQLIESINDDVVQQYTAILKIEYQKKRQEMGFNEKQFAITKDRESEKVYKEIHQGTTIQYDQLFKDVESYTKYEGTLLCYLQQKHRVQHQRPRTRKLTTIPSCQSPSKTLPIRPQTQGKTRASSSYKSKSKLKYNTLPYLLQY